MCSRICSRKRVRCAVLMSRTRPLSKAEMVQFSLRLTVMTRSFSGRKSTASGWVSYWTIEVLSASLLSSTKGQSTITSTCLVSSSRSMRELSSSSSAEATKSGMTPISLCIQARSRLVGATTLTQHPGQGPATREVRKTFSPLSSSSTDVLKHSITGPAPTLSALRSPRCPRCAGAAARHGCCRRP